MASVRSPLERQAAPINQFSVTGPLFIRQYPAMSFTVGCRWRGRPVEVTWEAGRLDGDDEVVAYLLSQEEAGEPIGVEQGRVIEPSFRSREEALDSLFSLIGPFSTLHGDLGGADPDDYAADELPDGRSALPILLLVVLILLVMAVGLFLALS